jgi:phosphate transport system permease protein
MRLFIRQGLDKIFTALTAATVVLLSLVLLVVLGPMILKGSSALLFHGTIEFRRMQSSLFNRGSRTGLAAEMRQTAAARQRVYDLIDGFRQGIDTEGLKEQAGRIHRQFGQELQDKGIKGQEYSDLRSLSRDLRTRLERSLDSHDPNAIQQDLGYVLGFADDSRFKGTSAEGFFRIARQFQKVAGRVDLARRREYASAMAELEDILAELLGPRPGTPLPPLVRQQYGATRWEQAQAILHRFSFAERWVGERPGMPLVRQEIPRRQQFAGTDLEPLFDYVPSHAAEMLRPRLTVYWQFLIDDSVESHTFGGVGPELLGTLAITLLGMLFVVPLGVISAAYLVEQAGDNWIVRIIRLCINTLAGVPSIVFGLFGLAFFVLTLLPALGMQPKPCVLAASLTLAVLTLPVMIRSSEEAIKSVPQNYKEGALALGASPFRAFVTVTLPAALPGILTGVILSLSRIAGETAPVLFTGAVAMGPVPKSLLDPTRTLSYGSYDMAVGDRIAMMFPHNQYGMVVTLVALILVLNALAIVLRTRVHKGLKGQ